jgi:hypothetical protein
MTSILNAFWMPRASGTPHLITIVQGHDAIGMVHMDISRIYRMPRSDVPTYGKLWQGIETGLLDAMALAVRKLHSQQLSQVFAEVD